MIAVNALYVLDWAIISISFFNTITYLWLGLTVLLNAERPRWSTWATGAGLTLAGLFFAAHTAIVGRELTTFRIPELEIWWRVGWLPFVAGPYMWYMVTASYAGVLGTIRHQIWLAVVTLLGLVAVALLVFANPLPSYGQVIHRTPNAIFSIGGIPVVMLVYPVYSLLCIVLALSALRHPQASERFMGDLARRRARPWLIVSSLVLLAVSLSVGAAVAWILSLVQSGTVPGLSIRSLAVIMGFDLLISGMLAVAAVLIGKAIVSYEIFTGKTLPRGGLARHWRRSLILAAGYGALIGSSLSLPLLVDLDQIYRLLMATLLMTLFYALLSWRSYTDRERSMTYLRPFVASQRLYERMLGPAAPPEVDITQPFRALCEDVLDARVAHLVALGPLAPLVGPPVTVGARLDVSEQTLNALAARLHSPQTMCVSLDPAEYGGAVWAVPLWSERGLIGVLLLGEKGDEGLYTQEEIEIARATGERLIDTQASAEMARRLTALQRQRLAESQVLDRRTRRVLHDDVLPRLHTAMLMLSATTPATNGQRPTTSGEPGDQRQPAIDNGQPDTLWVRDNGPYAEAVVLLADVHHEIANLLRAMPPTAAPEVARLGLIGALQQAIDGEFGNAFDGVTWQVEPQAEQAARTIPALAAEVFFYAAREAIRNAARYGRNGDSTRSLHLTVSVAWRGGLEMTIEDDGVGLGSANIMAQGSGQGLGLHSTMMAVVGGTLTTASEPGRYTRVALALPQGAWA